jgi:hypothetical protein
MGGCFQDKKLPKMSEKALVTAYSDLVAKEAWDSGHGGYTGTFAEKHELKVIPGSWEVDEARQDAGDNNDKWGPAFAYRLKTGEWYIAGWCSS